jgi:hypothetical protein
MTDTTINETTPAQIGPEVAKAETPAADAPEREQPKNEQAELMKAMLRSAMEGTGGEEKTREQKVEELAEGAKLLVEIIRSHYHKSIEAGAKSAGVELPAMMRIGLIVEEAACAKAEQLANSILEKAEG